MAGKKGAKWRELKPWSPSPEAAGARENYLTFAKRQETRFWAKARRTASGCLEWTGGTDKDGYGKFQISLPRLAKHQQQQRHVRAHRLAYELTKGPVAEDLLVLHSCDNPKCIEPAHLSIGTQARNRSDAVARGRVPRGEDHHSARLSEGQARELIRLRRSGTPVSELVRRFGVSKSHAEQIGTNTWRHLA